MISGTGSLETIGLLAGFASLLLGALCLVHAVATDATARGENGASWAFAAVVASPFVLPWYLYCQRRRFLPRRSPLIRLERVTGSIGVGILAAVVLSAMVTPPDPIALGTTLPVAAVVLVPVSYLVLYSSRTSIRSSAGSDGP